MNRTAGARIDVFPDSLRPAAGYFGRWAEGDN